MKKIKNRPDSVNESFLEEATDRAKMQDTLKHASFKIQEYNDLNGKSFYSEVKTDLISNDKGGGGVDTENSNRNSIKLNVARLAPYGRQVYIQPIQNISFNVAKSKKINETIVQTA